MSKRKLAFVGAFAAALSLAVAACGGSSGGGETAATTAASTGAAAGTSPATTAGSTGAAATGGTYRVEWEASFDFTDNFDPTGEYLGEAFAIYSNLLTRTLLGYNHVAGPPGNVLVPDLATSMPKVSSDGLTYTFTLKNGVKFGPPVNREITSKDILYAFERIGTKDVVAQYYGYYSAIKGMPEFYDGKAKTISGIETPDDKTIVFHLSEPTGDFLYRVAMPATGPIPPEVGKCFTKAGDYGRDVISSGPYMIEGSDQIDISSCSAIQPMSGYQPDKLMNLVRNPNYDPATDSPTARQNLVDRFEFAINTNNDDIYNRVKAGLIDDEIATETPKVLKEYTENPDLKPLLKSNAGDRTWYITMNLTQPPFDDIHVRKAVNYVMDKQGLRLAWGGSLSGDIATHIVPDTLFNEDLKGYDPYGSPEQTGDVAKAMAEMKQSKYDTNQDGLCDASVCKNILMITGDTASRKGDIPVIEDSLGKIGITLNSRSLADAYTPIQTVAKNIAISGQPGWGKDYADAYTFFYYLFNGSTIGPTGNVNYSLVGLTPEIIQKNGLKGLTGTTTGIPSVDSDIATCEKESGDDRNKCYEDLDKKLMEQVVPWVPYLWSNAQNVIGPAVTQWGFDQFSGSIAYAHVAVDPSKQQQG